MRILFFTPFATRTGSEVALFNLLSCGIDAGFQIGVACNHSGELLKQLPSAVPVFINDNQQLIRRAYNRVQDRLGGDAGFALRAHRAFKPDLWYINTIVLKDYIRDAQRHNIPCVVHSHEREQMLTSYSEEEVKTLVQYPQLVIAGSNTARNVFKLLGRKENMEVCYASIDPKRLHVDVTTRLSLRSSLRIGAQTFVWMMAGTLDPNKNPLRFISIALEMLRQGLDVHFIWLGGRETGYSHFVKQKVAESGMADKITFLGERTQDYYQWLNAGDGLVITSQIESFCLVAVEAAYLGKPIVSFNSGGVQEIITDGMGVVVDSWNTVDIISAMVEVMKGELFFDANIGAERVKEFFVDVQGVRWTNLLRERFGRSFKTGAKGSIR